MNNKSLLQKTNKISVVRILFPCNRDYIFQFCVLDDDNFIWTLTQSDYPQNEKMDNILHVCSTKLSSQIFVSLASSASNLRKDSPTLSELTCFSQ
jgi:hypothetical protein